MLKKADLILIGCVLLAALGFFGFHQYQKNSGQGGYVVVTIDGEEWDRISLAEDRTKTYLDEDGGSNTLVIRDGAASVTEANCPDGICIRQGEIRYNGETIVCLPHKLTVTVVNGEDSDIDSVAG